MRKMIYEKNVQYKLDALHSSLIGSQGKDKGNRTFKKIIDALDNLQMFSFGKNIKREYGIDCPDNWFLLYVEKNYFIFSKSEILITVLAMYNNRQDFINDLFGIEMRSDESKSYWGE